jgi:magnesium chelatase family protein
MQIASVSTRTFIGIHAQKVQIETHISNGLPRFMMVGLPETAVKESKERVRSAIINSQFTFPTRRITVNLSPAALPKSGSGFDLAIALSILCASNQLPQEMIEKYEFIGELALNGDIREVHTVLPALLEDTSLSLIIPKGNEQEASIASPKNTFYASHLLEVGALLTETGSLPKVSSKRPTHAYSHKLNWSEIKGQAQAKRALEIAVSGGHHAILFGPPGSGKTMLASRINTLLPNLSLQAQLETEIIQTIANIDSRAKPFSAPPYRHPHHSCSAVAMVGGGNPIKPGEISLAHNGILFLDELPEFKRDVLESLREPLENKKINISRASQTCEFPANFQLIAAFNPCPCGYFGHKNIACRCSSQQINTYQKKLSGPLLDRIDIFIDVLPLPLRDISELPASEDSEKVKNRVTRTQQLQRERQSCLNAALASKAIKKYCALSKEDQKYLENASEKLMLSARAYYRIIKIARTIADMKKEDKINKTHLGEALLYRYKSPSL